MKKDYSTPNVSIYNIDSKALICRSQSEGFREEQGSWAKQDFDDYDPYQEDPTYGW